MEDYLQGKQALPTPDLLHATVRDDSGRAASIVRVEGGDRERQVCLETDDGLRIVAAASLLIAQEDGSFRLPFSFRDSGSTQGIVIPVVHEELRIGKRAVETNSGVRIRKTATEREEVVNIPLLREEFDVTRVPLDTLLDGESPPQARYEGDTLIVPVVEEVLVVQKRLRLKEEIRIRRQQHETMSTHTVTLRKESVEVERFTRDGV